MEPNRVPAAPIVAAVRDYLNRQVDLSEAVYSNGRKELGPLAIFAIRCDMNEDTLAAILQGRNKTLDFNTADLFLTKMAAVDLWWGSLQDVYDSVLLDDENTRANTPTRKSGTRVCAAFECSNEFIPHARAPHRKFCSESCKRKTYWRNRRQREGAKPRFGTRYGACPNGHERTPENTHVRKNGMISCRDCGREKEAARYINDPEYRQRRIETARAYRDRKREERVAE